MISPWEYPSTARAAEASLSLFWGITVTAGPEMLSPAAEMLCPLASLSLSSNITRWAIFFPTPWAAVSAFSSPVMMLRARFSGVEEERIASAALGPTPETEVRSWNSRRSS